MTVWTVHSPSYSLSHLARHTISHLPRLARFDEAKANKDGDEIVGRNLADGLYRQPARGLAPGETRRTHALSTTSCALESASAFSVNLHDDQG